MNDTNSNVKHAKIVGIQLVQNCCVLKIKASSNAVQV